MARRPKTSPRGVYAPHGPAWVSGFLSHFDEMDRALVAFGFPATSPWWRSRIERFLRSGKKRDGVPRLGLIAT